MIRLYLHRLRKLRTSRRHRSRGRGAKQRVARAMRVERLEDRQLLAGVDFASDVPTTGVTADTVPYDTAPYEADSLLIRFRDDVSPDRYSMMGPTVAPLPFAAELGAEYSILPALREIRLPEYVSVETALELLQGHDAVLYAEPNYRIQVTATPNDPRYDELWGLNNDEQTGGTYDADIDAPEAWEATVGSSNTIVAVIDTGVDYGHEDLAANIWVNTGEIPGDGLDNDGNGYIDDVHGYDFANNDGDPMDDQGHGTHTAGTIGAVGDNGIGVTGVNWNVQIMAVKFLDASGSGDTDDAIRALDYAVANGATVSNNSWGYNGNFSQALYDSVKAARDADHVFVAAAGNGNFLGFGMDNDANPFWPANIDLGNVVSVAAVDHNDAKPLFSNYGATTVDLAAPGVDILSTVPNNGYGLNSGTSMASPHVAGVIALVRDLHPDWSYAQVINQVLQTVDPVSSMDGITVTGGRLNAAGAVGLEVVPSPEIQVLLGTENIADGGSQVDYGNTPPGLAIDLTFTVKNRGVRPLTLLEPISLPAGYSLAASFGTTVVDVGETTTFSVRLNGDVEGTYSGEVSFGNDDPDENPFNFTVTGTVAIPPAVQVIDNGDAAFAATGEWTQWTGQGYEGDIHESLAGTGQDNANWTFERILPGKYRVAATWTVYTNRATDSPFTVLDNNTALGTVDVNQQLAPAGFSENNAQWQYLDGAYTITGNTLVVELTDDANGRVNADAIRIERIDAVPEIDVRLEGAGIADGVTVIDLGPTTTGTQLQKTFTVRNLGGSDLVLSEPITVPEGFSLVSSFAATTLATDETTTFTVSLNAAAAGSFSGDVSFSSNDADESPFTFTVEGVVEDPPAVQIVDNGDTSFSTVGAWSQWSGQGYENDIHESLAGNGADVASWTFANPLPGYYRVAATWTTHSNRATDATFDVLIDGVNSTSATVNQQVAPNDLVDANTNWQWLGGTLLVESGDVVVQLNDAADGRVNADAIRLERLPEAPEVQVSAGGQILPDDTSTFDFGNTPPGIPVTQILSVENVGTEPLVLQEPIHVSAGFSLAASFGTLTLQPGESTTFAVQFDASAGGTTTGDVSFGSNDADESPFNIDVTGNVVIPPAVQIIDDGDAAFAAVGEWAHWTGQGFESDIDESLPGNGADTATWTFTGLMPGLYRVAATWTHYVNRASNAPFTILDDVTPLTTVYVNQRLAPSGITDAGANWQVLGSLHELTSSTLVVRLNDLADGRLNADAIRIERLDPAPEIQVTQGSTDLVDGTSNVNFGSTSLNAPVPMTFTVSNRGGEDLNLSEPIDVPAGFSVVSSFGQTTLSPDESTTFVLQMDAANVGTFSGTVALVNDDADESPFNFDVQATVLAPPSVVIVDNGDAGYTSVGQWSRWTGQGYLGDIDESLGGTGADVASWTFTNLLPGQYRVSATWTAFTNRASNSPFTLLDGSTGSTTIYVDQRVAPSGFSDAGVVWDDLVTTYQVDSGTLVVQLSDAADGRLNADAIRIERI